MVLPQENAAITFLKDFIQNLRTAKTPDREFVRELITLQVTIGQIERREDLAEMDEILAKWLGAVPQDFERPSFQQLIAHVVAIMFALHPAFKALHRARRVSTEIRPQKLKDDKVFLSSYVPEKFLDPALVPGVDLQRDCFQMLADLLLRAGMPIVPDEEVTELVGRYSLPQLILVLYMRHRRLGPRNHLRPESLEYRLEQAGVLSRFCRENPALVDFIGPPGLNIFDPEGWFSRTRRRLRRWFIERSVPSHRMALVNAYMVILILLFVNILLFGLFWNPEYSKAKNKVDTIMRDRIEAVTEELQATRRSGGN